MLTFSTKGWAPTRRHDVPMGIQTPQMPQSSLSTPTSAWIGRRYPESLAQSDPYAPGPMLGIRFRDEAGSCWGQLGAEDSGWVNAQMKAAAVTAMGCTALGPMPAGGVILNGRQPLPQQAGQVPSSGLYRCPRQMQHHSERSSLLTGFNQQPLLHGPIAL